MSYTLRINASLLILCLLMLSHYIKLIESVSIRTQIRLKGAKDGDGVDSTNSPPIGPATGTDTENTDEYLKTPASARAQPSVANLEAPNYFPTGPPPPPPSSIPPPLAPSGRWLHTGVLLDGSMYIYGGVASYSTALYNDLWLYNYAEDAWFELHASYIPPFPVETNSKKASQDASTQLDDFVPDGVPRGDAFVPPPDNSMELKPANPGSAPKQPIIKEQPHQPTYVKIDYSPLPRSAFKQTLTAFLEESIQVRMKTLHSMPKTVDISKTKPNKMSPFISADLWRFDVDTKLWSLVKSKSPNVPAPRWLHTAVELCGAMVIFGGVSFADVILGDIWVFRPGENTWNRGNPLGTPILPREGHSAVVLDKTMYVFGGISYSHLPFNDVWTYKCDSNEWAMVQTKGNPPPPRWLHTAVIYEDKAASKKYMVIFGGVTRNWVPLDDLYMFDFATSTWLHPKVVGAAPFPRMLHSAVVVRNKMIIHGGIANNIPFEDMWVFDFKLNVWTEDFQSGAYPFAREGHSMISVYPEPPMLEPDPPQRIDPPKEYPEYVDPLTPLIKNFTTLRPLNRFIKSQVNNVYILMFGGAGPKPRYDQP